MPKKSENVIEISEKIAGHYIIEGDSSALMRIINPEKGKYLFVQKSIVSRTGVDQYISEFNESNSDKEGFTPITFEDLDYEFNHYVTSRDTLLSIDLLAGECIMYLDTIVPMNCILQRSYSGAYFLNIINSNDNWEVISLSITEDGLAVQMNFVNELILKKKFDYYNSITAIDTSLTDFIVADPTDEAFFQLWDDEEIFERQDWKLVKIVEEKIEQSLISKYGLAALVGLTFIVLLILFQSRKFIQPGEGSHHFKE